MNKKFNAILVSDKHTKARIKKMVKRAAEGDEGVGYCCPWSQNRTDFFYDEGPKYLLFNNDNINKGGNNPYCNSCRKVMKVTSSSWCPCNFHEPDEIQKIIENL